MDKAAGGVVFERVSKRYGDVTAVDDVSFRVQPAQLVHAARALRLRQDDDAAHGRGPRAGVERPHRDRRQRRHAARRQRARRQHGVPVVRAVPAHDGARERLLRPALDARRQGEGARARARRSSRCSASPDSSSGCRRSCPAASSSASRWRARWCSSRRCCCSTSRCRTSTRSCAAACARRSASCSSRSTLTVIYVTHDQEEALAVSDHIIVMDGGRIAQQGTPRRRSTSSRRAASSPTSSATRTSSTASSRSRGDGASFAAGGVCAPVRGDGMAPGPATLAVRPNRLRVVDAGAGRAARRAASAPPISAAASSTSWPPPGASSSCSTTSAPRAPRATMRSASRSIPTR